jgi:hypothetical protein
VKAKEMVALYIDQEEEIINLISSDIIWTWFQDLYPTTHYYDVRHGLRMMKILQIMIVRIKILQKNQKIIKKKKGVMA